MPATRTCREYIDKYGDSRVNCRTCVKWQRDIEKCGEEKAVVKRYEDSPAYAEYDKMMRDAKDIRLEA